MPVFGLPGPAPRKVCDPASRSWLTSSGVASNRTAPSCEEPDRSTRLRGPKVRWSFDLSGPASGTGVPRSQNRPVFCGPSWVDHSCVPLRSPTIRRPPGAASRLRKTDSSGASSRLAPTRTRRLSPLPAGGDRTFGHLPLFVPFPALGEAGTAVPITCSQCTGPPSRES